MLVACLLVAPACTRATGPEHVAIAYTRALYARDLGGMYALVSVGDRQVKSETAFRVGEATGFALELGRLLASYIHWSVADLKYDGTRATVTLGLRLPDARAPSIAQIVGRWDDRRLNGLSAEARTTITRQIEALRAAGLLPMTDGQQTFELSKEETAWRMHAGWTESRRVRFHAVVDAVPLDVAVDRLHVTAPPRQGGWIAELVPLAAATRTREVVLAPGERVHVVLTVRNASARAVTARAGHRIEPTGPDTPLAILRCPLLTPVTLAAGALDEYASEYLLVPSASPGTQALDVTYEIRAAAAAGRLAPGAR